MPSNVTYRTREIKAGANAVAGELADVQMPVVKHYTRVTGISVVDLKDHNNFGFGINTHDDQVEVAILPKDMWAPQNNTMNDGFRKTDIALHENEVLIKPKIFNAQAAELHALVVFELRP